MHKQYVGCYILYARCACVMWAVIGAVWAVTASMDDVQVLCGLLHLMCWLLQPLCVTCRCYVGLYILYVDCYRRRVGRYSLYA